MFLDGWFSKTLLDLLCFASFCFASFLFFETPSSIPVLLPEALYMLTGALDGPTGDGARDGNFGALIIVVIFAPIGQLVVSLFISAILQEQDLKNALDRKHNENKAFIQRAVEILGIPKELQRRVFSMHYFQKMSHDIEAFQILFDGKNVSGALSSALKVHLYQESVLNCNYLSQKDPNYIIEVVKILQDVVYLPGEYVVRRGEIGHQMFFVARGVLSVLVPDLERPKEVQHAKNVNKLKLSDNFGAVALVQDCVRTAWIRADSYALLASLSRHDIESVWKYFPEYKEELCQEVKMVAQRDKQRNAQNRWKNFGGKDKKQALLKLGKSQENLSARSSVLAAADNEEDSGVLASGDSAALTENEQPDTNKMLSEILQRQSALEKSLKLQSEQLEQLLAKKLKEVKNKKKQPAQAPQVLQEPQVVEQVEQVVPTLTAMAMPETEPQDPQEPIEIMWLMWAIQECLPKAASQFHKESNCGNQQGLDGSRVWGWWSG